MARPKKAAAKKAAVKKVAAPGALANELASKFDKDSQTAASKKKPLKKADKAAIDYTLTDSDKKNILKAFKKAAEKVPAPAPVKTSDQTDSLNLFIYKRKTISQ